MRWFFIAVIVLYVLAQGITIGNFHAHARIEGLELLLPGLVFFLSWFYFFFIRGRTFRHQGFDVVYGVSVAIVSVGLIFMGVNTSITGGCENLLQAQGSDILANFITYVQSENHCRTLGIGMIVLGVLGIRSSLGVYRELTRI